MENFTESQNTSNRSEPNGAPPKKRDINDFIASPGLIDMIPQFEALYNAAERRPIIIIGETGVGKSLFLRIFERLWQKETKRKEQIPRVNCSHFSPDMARSELFGHVKGAYTGAFGQKDGWIRAADQKRLPLVLYEIGELSPEVQAKLLTFIEDGRFFKMGSTKIEEADVQIIGATNNEEKLRNEFRQRFLSFYIPPLHQRRVDILYHLYHKFPDLVKTLRPWEVLALLSYNWPGNVREIERVARLLQIFRDTQKYRPGIDKERLDSSPQLYRLYYLSPDFFLRSPLGKTMGKDGFSAQTINNLYYDLKGKGVDVKDLERLLNKYRLGLVTNTKLAFPELSENPPEMNCETDYQERFGIKAYKNYEPFEESFEGFILFCFLFFQVTQFDKNAVEVKKGIPLGILHSDVNFFHFLSEEHREQYNPPLAEKLQKPIFEYLSGVHLSRETRIPKQFGAREIFFNDLFTQNPSSQFLASITGREVKESTAVPDIFSMTDIDLQKYMYRGILDRCGGNQKQAAVRLGLNYNTFRGRLKKLGMV